MFLNRAEESLLNGESGPGPQYAMQVLSKFGDAVKAEKMVPITASHASYTARFIAREPGIKWLTDLAATNAKTRVPLTSQCTEFDLKRWKIAQQKLNGMEVPGGATMVFRLENYYLPFPQDEIDRNPELVQNDGY